MVTPHLITLSTHSEQDRGQLVSFPTSTPLIPFSIKRLYYTTNVPTDVVRGNHAHRLTEQVLFALAGRIEVTTQMRHQPEQHFSLDSSSIGLYIPARCWHNMRYSAGAVQLVVASTEYDPSDYIYSLAEL